MPFCSCNRVRAFRLLFHLEQMKMWFHRYVFFSIFMICYKTSRM